MIKSVYRLIKKTINNFPDKWYEERVCELKEVLIFYLRKTDGTEIPYYTVPKKIWEGRGVCQVFSPIKRDVIVYDLDKKEKPDPEKIITSFIITSQFFNDNDFKTFKWMFGDCKTKRDEYILIKSWVRFFGHIYLRNLFKRWMDTYILPILIAVASAVITTLISGG